MKKSTYLLVILLMVTMASIGQVTAIFVNDESESEQSTLLVYESLKDQITELAFFNASDSLRSPTLNEMLPYRLVIWYCGSDDNDLYFWNGNDQVNTALVNYLDNGGTLWLMSSGFLNDRFLSSPQVFRSPFFEYDYLGIWQWVLESFTDDGGNGVPQLDISDDNPLQTLTLATLNWDESPEPFVDGCLPADNTRGVYEFAPDSYLFSGNLAGFYCTTNDMNNLVFTFDPARLQSEEMINTLFSEVVDHYNGVLDVEEGIISEKELFNVYPNPAVTGVNLVTSVKGPITIRLIDILGNDILAVEELNQGSDLFTIRLDVSDLPGGLYFLTLEYKQSVISKSLVISRN